VKKSVKLTTRPESRVIMVSLIKCGVTMVATVGRKITLIATLRTGVVLSIAAKGDSKLPNMMLGCTLSTGLSRRRVQAMAGTSLLVAAVGWAAL